MVMGVQQCRPRYVLGCQASSILMSAMNWLKPHIDPVCTGTEYIALLQDMIQLITFLVHNYNYTPT